MHKQVTAILVIVLVFLGTLVGVQLLADSGPTTVVSSEPPAQSGGSEGGDSNEDGNSGDDATSSAETPAPTPTDPTDPGDPAPQPAVEPPVDAAEPEPVDVVAEGGLTIEVDPGLAPSSPTVPGVDELDPDRSVGRLVDDEGAGSDLVLGELIVATDDPNAIAGFLGRHDGVIVEQYETAGSPIIEFLVRVAPTVVDPAVAASRLTVVEPDHTGTYGVSDPGVLSLIDIAATEASAYGLEVSINWLTESTSIATGDVSEDPALGNGFEVDYLRLGGPYDTGVTGAWQLLEQHDRLDNTVEVLIADGGFFLNDDFPTERKIRLAGWNEQNPGSCGSPCPTHGTDVALTAVARVDNGFGVSGVAGPVGTLVAVQFPDRDIFTQFRKIRDVVEEERPDVVNLSFSAEIKLFRDASQASADRVIGDIVDTGAIVFASAGNDGKNIDGRACVFGNCYENRLHIPCESKHAICVGGLRANGPTGTWLHDGSNHGTAGGNRSVELYAPYCVQSLFNFTNGGTETVCGTSFSSPFTAGAAALVLAADPSLDRHEVKDILLRTAHVGGVHFDHYIAFEHQRRVDAFDAVLDALGVEVGPPTVEITAPGDFDEVTITDWFELEATAHDFKGEPLAVTWESSIEGLFETSLDPVTVFELTEGTHTITARVTDYNGVKRSDSINLVVRDNPPELTISWPPPGTTVYAGTDITLVGGSIDPDTNQFLDDDEVRWELSRNGNVLVERDGHAAFVSGNALTPGSYDVRFIGDQGDNPGVAVSSFGVQALPPGEDAPSALITTDFQAEPYGAYNSQPVAFTLTGVGTDPQDGAIPGTRMRWVAHSGGATIVLCEGSAFNTVTPPDLDDDDDGPAIGGFAITPINPGPVRPVGPGTISTLKDCSSVDVELRLLAASPVTTHYTIELQVKDSAGYQGQDQAAVTLTFVTG